jgi:hypothetical protein
MVAVGYRVAQAVRVTLRPQRLVGRQRTREQLLPMLVLRHAMLRWSLIVLRAAPRDDGRRSSAAAHQHKVPSQHSS